MSSELQSPSPADQQSRAPLPSPTSSKFRLKNVLVIVIPVAMLAVAAVSLSRYGNLDEFLEDINRPHLAAAKGRVIFEGKPLSQAQVVTQPANGNGLAAIGWTDDEGRFALQTDIRGKFKDGATIGAHRVAVTVYKAGAGASPPSLLTPEAYAVIGTSPLQITVVPRPEQNEFDLILEGSASERRSRRPAPKDDTAPKGDAAEIGPTADQR